MLVVDVGEWWSGWSVAVEVEVRCSAVEAEPNFWVTATYPTPADSEFMGVLEVEPNL